MKNLTIHLHPEDVKAVQAIAERRGISYNEQLVQVIEKGLAADEQSERRQPNSDRRKGQITYEQYCALHGITPKPQGKGA